MPKASKIAVGAAVVVVVLVVGAGAAQLAAQHEARMRVTAALAALPPGSAAHYSVVQYNLFTGTLRLDGLAITRDGQPTLAIDRTVLHNVSGAGTLDNPYRADRVRMIGLTAHQGARSVKVATFDAQAVALLAAGAPPPQGTPAWLITPDGTLVSAGTVVANGIADDQGETLATISVSGYRAGRIDELAAADFADAHGHRIAEASGSAIDINGLDRVFDARRYTPDASTWPTPHPLIGHAEVNGFVNHGADGSVGSLDRLSIDMLAGRPFASAPIAANEKTPAFLRDAAKAITFGSIRLSGLNDTDAATKTTIALHGLSAKTYATGALAQFSLDGFAMSKSTDHQVTIGHFDLSGLNLASLLQKPVHGSLWNTISAADGSSTRLDSLNLTGVAVTGKVGGAVKLDSLSESVVAGPPLRSTLTMRGLAIPADTLRLQQNPLVTMGIDTLTLDLDEAWTFDAATNSATIQQIKLTGRGLGIVTLSGTLTNLPRGTTTAGAMIAALGQIAVGSLTVTYANDTLVQRAISMQAGRSGKTTADVISMAKLAGSFMAAAAVPEQPDAGAQVAAFLDNPKSLTITATPQTPVPLADFEGQAWAAARQAMNLHLTAN